MAASARSCYPSFPGAAVPDQRMVVYDCGGFASTRGELGCASTEGCSCCLSPSSLCSHSALSPGRGPPGCPGTAGRSAATQPVWDREVSWGVPALLWHLAGLPKRLPASGHSAWRQSVPVSGHPHLAGPGPRSLHATCPAEQDTLRARPRRAHGHPRRDGTQRLRGRQVSPETAGEGAHNASCGRQGATESGAAGGPGAPGPVSPACRWGPPTATTLLELLARGAHPRRLLVGLLPSWPLGPGHRGCTRGPASSECAQQRFPAGKGVYGQGAAAGPHLQLLPEPGDAPVTHRGADLI